MTVVRAMRLFGFNGRRGWNLGVGGVDIIQLVLSVFDVYIDSYDSERAPT
jgi:hypothetical protein